MSKIAFAPHVGGSLARHRGTCAATPFIGEDHLRAVVVESRRVPVGEILVHDFVETHRIDRIGNIQQDAVARARTGRQSQFWKDRQVVALIRRARALRPGPVIPALPEARDGAGRPVRENARTADDAGLLRRRERHLDDIDAEQRRIRVLFRIQRRAALQLLG